MKTINLNVLRKTCLKPSYSLRYQLWVSFGSISAIAILILVCSSIAVSVASGNLVKSHADDILTKQVLRTIKLSSGSVAETVSRNYDRISEAVSILAETTRDRVVGLNWETDDQVPFVDMETNTRRYPLSPVILPPDWNITTNVNEENYKEHIQETRRYWYKNLSTEFSTYHAAFRFQGQCDPDAAEGEKTYYPNCTEANNDVTTCGVLHPVASKLYEKAGVLQYVMKPLYEVHESIKLLGVYFFNEGAGASVIYPPFIIDGTSSYESLGCEWMLNNTNPFTGRAFATREQVARCHKEGELVPGREYNPFERGWCQYQILAGGKPIAVGPYIDAFQKDLWLVTFGQAVFDRMTGELIACTLADVSVSYIGHVLNELWPANGTNSVALVAWNDGEIIAGGGVTRNSSTDSLKITGGVLTKEEFERLKYQIYVGNENRTSNNVLSQAPSGRGKTVAAYPIPTPPEEFDPTYDPTTMLITIVDAATFDVVREMEEEVVNDVRHLVALSVIMGVLGLLVSLTLIFLVSRWLTLPLQWMERVSKRILYSETHIHDGEEPLMRFSPKTEITDLVMGFRRMINGFSGDGPARIAQETLNEIPNPFQWTREVNQLYLMQRQGLMESFSTPLVEALDEPTPRNVPVQHRGSLRASFTLDPYHQEETGSSSSSDAIKLNIGYPVKEESLRSVALPITKWIPKRCHFGRNILPETRQDTKQYDLHKTVTHSPVIRRSPLFWWIVFLIVIPILLTFALMAFIVSSKILETLPGLLEGTNGQSFMLEKDNIRVMTSSSAVFTSEIILEKIRDLHLLQRFAEWLFLGVIGLTSTFTEVEQATEECKVYPPHTCPVYWDIQRCPCDCEWLDTHELFCMDYDINPRYLQRRFFVGQSHDTDPVTGDRSSVSYPMVDDSPQATSWWDDINLLPGSEIGLNASGYNTTYARVRVLSAMAVIEFPIFNYATSRKRKKHLGTFIGLEADGMLTGFAGCEYSHIDYARFQSTEENGAAHIRPDLCPLGKYGYDARCRDWYAQGKTSGEIHLTAPYKYAGAGGIASGITSSIVDPIRNRHIGQVLINFIPEQIVRLDGFDAVVNGKGLAFLITPSNDILGGDTVVGPGYSLGETAPAIQDLVMAYDVEGSTLRSEFDNIVAAMKNGTSGDGEFSRTLQRGEKQTLFYSFAPILIRTVNPVNSSDFGRGVNENEKVVYSLCMAFSTTNFPDSSSDEAVEDQLWTLLGVFIGIGSLMAICVTFVTSMVAIGVTRPVVILCGIVKSINEDDIQDDIPPMPGGSREVNQVYNSFAKLYKIIRFSNTAFFSGKIEWALKFLIDAEKLFRTVDDKKAIGIVLNNLGNTYLSLYLSKRRKGGCYKLNGRCVKDSAWKCYSEAIEIASAEYELIINDESRDDETKAEYARQLADRYFNRGLFYLKTAEDPCSSTNQNDLAQHDLEFAAQLDTDVRDYWITTRSITRNSDLYFERLIRRSSGLVCTLENCFGDVETLLFEADSLLCSIGRDDQAPLVQNVRLCGRLQQLEEIAIRNELQRFGIHQAARHAVRMLIEDEFLLESAFAAAAEAILRSMQTQSVDNVTWCADTVQATKEQLRVMLRSCKSVKTLPYLEKNVIFCYGLGMEEENLRATQEGVVDLLNKVCDDQDKIGLVVYGDEINEGLCFDLSRKSSETSTLLSELSITGKGRHDLAVGFLRCLQMVESDSSKNDTWLVLVTDADAWNNGSDVHGRYIELSHQKPMHVLVLGIDLNEPAKTSFRSFCRQKNSALIEATSTSTSILESFMEIANVIGGGVGLRGFSVEKF